MDSCLFSLLCLKEVFQMAVERRKDKKNRVLKEGF